MREIKEIISNSYFWLQWSRNMYCRTDKYLITERLIIDLCCLAGTGMTGLILERKQNKNNRSVKMTWKSIYIFIHKHSAVLNNYESYEYPNKAVTNAAIIITVNRKI